MGHTVESSLIINHIVQPLVHCVLSQLFLICFVLRTICIILSSECSGCSFQNLSLPFWVVNDSFSHRHNNRLNIQAILRASAFFTTQKGSDRFWNEHDICCRAVQSSTIYDDKFAGRFMTYWLHKPVSAPVPPPSHLYYYIMLLVPLIKYFILPFALLLLQYWCIRAEDTQVIHDLHDTLLVSRNSNHIGNDILCSQKRADGMVCEWWRVCWTWHSIFCISTSQPIVPSS